MVMQVAPAMKPTLSGSEIESSPVKQEVPGSNPDGRIQILSVKEGCGGG